MTDVELRRGPGHDEMAARLAAYQLGALPLEERRAFEAHALECDVCFEELERGATVAAALREDRERWREALGENAARARQPRGAWGWLLRPWVLAPAAAAAVLLLTMTRQPAGPDALRHLATFPLPSASSVVRGPSAPDAASELIDAGLSHLDLEQYDEAEQHFRAVLQRDPQQLMATYLLGLTLARRGNADAALPLLETAAGRATGSLRTEIAWTLANAHLALGHVDEARGILQGLASTADPRAAEARDLLRKLSR